MKTCFVAFHSTGFVIPKAAKNGLPCAFTSKQTQIHFMQDKNSWFIYILNQAIRKNGGKSISIERDQYQQIKYLFASAKKDFLKIQNMPRLGHVII